MLSYLENRKIYRDKNFWWSPEDPYEQFLVKHFFKILVKKFCPSLPAVLFHFFPQASYSTTLVENVFHLDLTLLAYKRVFTLYPDMCKVNLEDYKNDQNNHPFNV